MYAAGVRVSTRLDTFICNDHSSNPNEFEMP